MTFQYTYIKISNYFFCLNQNPAVLAWVLFLKKRDLHSICNPWGKKEIRPGILNHARRVYNQCVHNIGILRHFILLQLKLRNITESVYLPVFGHLCMHVHKGYKVFDLSRKMVIKVFDSDVDKESILDEIGRLNLASGLTFAPTVGNSDIGERWNEEEYISEYPPSSYKSMEPAALLSAFHVDILPCLNKLMLFKKPLSAIATDYADKMYETLEKDIVSENLFDAGEVDLIRSFIKSVIGLIYSHGNAQILLVFSHGDFCPANILKTRHGLRVLDWEGVDQRSALFDFYSYIFYLPVCINHKLTATASFTDETLQAFIADAASTEPRISKSMSDNADLYRLIFYLEFIFRLVERVITDKNLDIRDFIKRYIDAFYNYENIHSNNLQISCGTDACKT